MSVCGHTAGTLASWTLTTGTASRQPPRTNSAGSLLLWALSAWETLS